MKPDNVFKTINQQKLFLYNFSRQKVSNMFQSPKNLDRANKQDFSVDFIMAKILCKGQDFMQIYITVPENDACLLA